MAKVLGGVFLLLVGFLVLLGGYSGADAQDTDTPTMTPWPTYTPSLTPSPMASPVYVTATPAGSFELFPTRENGCPDWSYLGEGTSTPMANDVSMDYAIDCGYCLAPSSGVSIGGGVIAVPVINTPAGSGGGPVMLLSDVEGSLFSPYSYVSFYVAPLWGADWVSWPELDGYFALASAAFNDLQVVGLLFDVDVVQGSGHARALGSLSGLVRDSFWLDEGSYCVGIQGACDAVGAGSRRQYYGNVVTVETALEGFQVEGVGSMVEGRLNNIDFIVREGFVPLPVIGSTPTPMPTNTPDWVVPDYWENSCEYDFSVWSPNQTIVHYFPCQFAVQADIVAAVLDGIGNAGGNGNAVWSEAGNYSLASYTASQYRTYAGCFYVGSSGSVGDLYCQSHYPSYPRRAINQDAFLDGALRVVVTGNNVTVWGRGTIKQVFDSGVVSWPTPTPGVLTPTPTLVWGTVEDCSVVEWRSGDGSDVLTWDWGGWLSEPECYMFIPHIDETIPLGSIPFLGLDDVSLEFPGFEICLQFVDFPSFSVFGLAVHLDWFLVGLLVFLAGWLIRM